MTKLIKLALFSIVTLSLITPLPIFSVNQNNFPVVSYAAAKKTSSIKSNPSKSIKKKSSKNIKSNSSKPKTVSVRSDSKKNGTKVTNRTRSTPKKK